MDLRNINEYYGINENNLPYATELGLIIENRNNVPVVSYLQIWSGPGKWFSPIDGPNPVTPFAINVKENFYYSDESVAVEVTKAGEQAFVILVEYLVLQKSIRVKYFTFSFNRFGNKTFIIPLVFIIVY